MALVAYSQVGRHYSVAGVTEIRRGWLTPPDILITYTARRFPRWLSVRLKPSPRVMKSRRARPPPAGSLLFWVRRAGALISNVNAAGIAQGGSTTTQ